jgi:hypothetical protein
MKAVQLAAVPAHEIAISLGGQSCVIKLQQKPEGLFMDLSLDGKLIVAGVLCQHCARLIRNNYSGFAGDLSFIDLQGTSPPHYKEFGDRYVLLYLEGGE